jgi:hypothetical protein
VPVALGTEQLGGECPLGDLTVYRQHGILQGAYEGKYGGTHADRMTLLVIQGTSRHLAGAAAVGEMIRDRTAAGAGLLLRPYVEVRGQEVKAGPAERAFMHR